MKKSLKNITALYIRHTREKLQDAPFVETVLRISYNNVIVLDVRLLDYNIDNNTIYPSLRYKKSTEIGEIEIVKKCPKSVSFTLSRLFN